MVDDVAIDQPEIAPPPTRQGTTKPQASSAGQGMMGMMGIFKVLALLFAAFAKPDALKELGLEDSLSNLLGFDNPEEMNEWRESADGNFAKAAAGANWNEIDSQKVEQEYHKYSNLVDSGNPLLEVIGEHESAGDYNVAYGGKRPEIDGKPLSECTIRDVRDWQRDYVRSGSPSSAVGKYQIIQRTMDGLVEELAAEDGVSTDEFMENNTFDARMQDRMAVKLLERRGLDKFLNGGLSEEKFMNNLSKEWASFPKDASGLSYYAGDGINGTIAGAQPESVIAAMRAHKEHVDKDFSKKGSLTEEHKIATTAQSPLEKAAQPEPKTGLSQEFQTAALGEASGTQPENIIAPQQPAPQAPAAFA